MPRINQEKTTQLYEKQSISIDSLFVKTTKNTSDHIKNILIQHIGDTKSAKYYETLKILRYARNDKNISSKLFTEGMVKAIEEFTELGMSKKTINDIISIVYDRKCNYYNTEAKINALDISIIGDFWYSGIDCENQMKGGVGGECSTLAIYTYNKFLKKDIVSRIKKETKKDVIVGRCGGNLDIYFTWNNDHQFLYLDIGDKTYIIDPSFGVVANIKDTSYEIDAQGPTQEGSEDEYGEYVNENLSGAMTGSIFLNEGKNKIGCDFQGIPLGFLSGTNIFLGLGFAKTDFGKKIPMLAGTDPNTNVGVFFIKDKKLCQIRKNGYDQWWHIKEVSQEISHKITPILTKLMKYSEDIDAVDKSVKSGRVLRFNSYKGEGFIIPDEGGKSLFIKSNRLLKDGESVKYTEMNGGGMLLDEE